MIRTISLAFMVFCLFTLSSCKEPEIKFSPTEEQIKSYLVSHQTEQLLLLEKLVNINSGTSNVVGVRKVGKILQTEFDQLGFKTRWEVLPDYMHRAPTLIAERKGSRGKKLLLIGHLDTVFPADSPFQKFKREGDVATGPGVIDIKGGDLVILYALKALQATHAIDNTTITVVLTGDEENSGKPTAISRKALYDVARNSDVALDFECALSNNTASIARRGISMWTLQTQGTEAHSSSIFKKSVGYGAIFELARILNTMRDKLGDEKPLTFNPGLVLGGTMVNYSEKTNGTAFGKENVVAKNALAKGDLRFLTAQQKQNVEEKIKTIVSKHLPGTSATIAFQDGIPSMPPTAKNELLLKQYSAASERWGFGAVHALAPDARGAGDISFIAAIVPANLVGLGPLGYGAHSAQEKIEIPSLWMQTQRAAGMIYQLTR